MNSKKFDNELLSRCIQESSNIPKIEMFRGFWRQTLVSGDSLMLCMFTWQKGAELPAHSHEQEQAGYVICGTVELTLGSQTIITKGGCSYFVPSNTVHSARCLEDSLVIDAFSPPRKEYLLQSKQHYM